MQHVKLFVRWYGSAPAEDTVEPPARIQKILLQAIGAGCGNNTQGNSDRETEMGSKVEHTPPVVPASVLVKITALLWLPRVHGAVINDSSRRKVTTGSYCTLSIVEHPQ